jgi:uncharacterized delta-60 repeat protein
MTQLVLRSLVFDKHGRQYAVGTFNANFALARFNQDGTFDYGFGNNGVSISSAATDGNSIVVLSDGSLIATGYSLTGGWSASVAKYSVDGEIVSDFGTSGFEYLNFLDQNVGQSLHQLRNGNILLTSISSYGGGHGAYYNPLGGQVSIGVSIFDVSGNLVSSFSDDGLLNLGDSIFPWWTHGTSQSINGSEKIVIAGTKHTPTPDTSSSETDVFVTRINLDGSIDTSFGIQGSTTVDFQQNQICTGLVIGKSNEIYVVGSTADQKGFYDNPQYAGVSGYSYGSSADFFIASLASNGKANSKFGVKGYTTTDFGGRELAHAAVLQGEKLVVVGQQSNNFTDFQDDKLIVARYLSSGKLDTSFGKSGFTAISFGFPSASHVFEVTDVKINPDNDIYVLFTTGATSATIRFNPNGALISSKLIGGGRDDEFTGTDVSDLLFGMEGDDVLIGGFGNDILVGGAGDDSLDGGSGIDSCNYAEATAGVEIDLESGIVTSISSDAGIGTDTLANIENAIGSSSDDIIVGNSANNTVSAGEGDDEIETGDGNDIVYAGGGDDLIVGGNGKGDDRYFGGEGTDKIKYLSATWGISVDLGKGTAASLINPNDAKNKDASGTGKDSLNSIENLIAGNYNDILVGSKEANQIEGMDGNDRIDGKEGNDTLLGGANNDTLIGGVGNDSLTGGAGNDRFVFGTPLNANSNVDIVADFGDGVDKLVLGKSIFKFAKGMVNKDGSMNSSATVNSYLIITGSGSNWSVSYDADGTGTKSQAVKFVDVTLTGQATLTVTDFLVL